MILTCHTKTKITTNLEMDMSITETNKDRLQRNRC